MRCGEQDSGKWQEVVLVFKRKELLYDIRNACFIEGHIMEGDNLELRHTVQDVGEAGNIDRVCRVLSLAHSDVVERLYPFTRRDIDSNVLDNRLRERHVYGIVLRLPDGFSQTSVNLLRKLIHELLVAIVVADWLSITNTAKAQVWNDKAELLFARIAAVCSHRHGGKRTRIRPNWI